MSDFSLTLVLQFKTSKIINDMAKVQIKSEKVTPFGGIFHVRELFSRYMAPIIDKVLGLCIIPITRCQARCDTCDILQPIRDRRSILHGVDFEKFVADTGTGTCLTWGSERENPRPMAEDSSLKRLKHLMRF